MGRVWQCVCFVSLSCTHLQSVHVCYTDGNTSFGGISLSLHVHSHAMYACSLSWMAVLFACTFYVDFHACMIGVQLLALFSWVFFFGLLFLQFKSIKYLMLKSYSKLIRIIVFHLVTVLGVHVCTCLNAHIHSIRQAILASKLNYIQVSLWLSQMSACVCCSTDCESTCIMKILFLYLQRMLLLFVCVCVCEGGEKTLLAHNLYKCM